MQAKLKSDYPYRTIRACAGAEFVKDEYRPVPVGREGEALANPHLEIEPAPVVETEAAPVKKGKRK